MTYTAHVDTFARDNLPPESQWPELIFELPELQYPKRLNCAAVLLDKMVAGGHGERTVIHTLIDGKAYSCTYRQLLHRANRIARVLTEDMGLKPGNRVLLRAPNNPMMAACWFAVIKAGLVAVATMPLLRATELRQIIDKAKVGAALCDLRLREEMELAQAGCPGMKQVLYFNDDGPGSLEQKLSAKPSTFANVDTAADDVCLITFTSGTTGQPKGTAHFHRSDLLSPDGKPGQEPQAEEPEKMRLGGRGTARFDKATVQGGEWLLCRGRKPASCSDSGCGRLASTTTR